jgi:mxaK protein
VDINPKTRWLRGLLGLLLALAALMVVDLWRLSHIHGWNRAIADGSVVSLEGVLPPEAQFAKAFVLERRGAHQRALSLYKEIDATEHRDLAAAANYNSANIYLRWALELHAQEGERQAMPLFELAKQSYRDLLRSHDQLWDARYNLERALRLFPDSGGQTDAAGPSPLHSERAITTMRGFTLGLP